MKESHLVYIYTNSINNKVYIGQTKNSKKRCAPCNYVGCTYFYSAIQKYKWENFFYTILKENLSPTEADYWEIYYIKHYDSTNHQKGYNLSTGGDKKCVLIGENNGFYNKKHTPESLLVMKEKKKGGNNPNAKEVVCLNTGEHFPSCAEASAWCGIARQNISRCCKGGKPSAGKHPLTKESLHWRYKEDLENENRKSRGF